MKINILTLFPDYLNAFCNQSMIAKALELGHIEINIINFRDYSLDKHHKVDDSPYGGGAGMLLQIEPIDLALQPLKIVTKFYFHRKERYLVKKSTWTCKIKWNYFNMWALWRLWWKNNKISRWRNIIGDFILTGGEIAAMAISEAVARLIPGVLRKNSYENESFEGNGLLDYPQYTRPAVYKGMKVPKILLSGNHLEIEKWRLRKAREITRKKRPELLKKGK